MPTRVGVIGLGIISRFHLEHMQKIRGVKIAAVCDLVEEKVEAAAETYRAAGYTDCDEMYRQEKLDCVYILIPPFAHEEQEMEAVRRGIPIFVEKPIHLDLKKAKTIARAIQRKGLVSCVGYQDRYQDIADRMKRHLVGDPAALFTGYWLGGLYSPMWWRQKKMSGGQHVEQTTHIFDMSRNLFGEVKTIFAGKRTGLMADVPKYSIEDASAVTLMYKSGVLGVIFSACCLKGGGRVGMDIYCRNSVVEYAGRHSLEIRARGRRQYREVGNDFGQAIDNAFIADVRAGNVQKVRSTYADAVKTLELSLLATESMETGKPVHLK